MIRVIFLINAFILFCCGWSEASLHTTYKGQKGTSVVIDISKDKISLGETFDVSITMNYPKGYKPVIEDLSQNLLHYFAPTTPPFQLLTSRTTPSNELSEKKEHLTTKVTFTLTPQLTGTFQLSLLKIVFAPEDPKETSAIEIITDIYTIDITAPSDIRDPAVLIAPLFPIDRPYTLVGLNEPGMIRTTEEAIATNKKIIEERSFPWIFLLSSAVLFAVFWLIKYTNAAEIKSTPADIDVEGLRKNALRKLGQITKEQEARSDEIQTIDAIMRQYLEDVYKIHAPRETSQEFLNDVALTKNFDNKTISHMQQLYEHIDMAKYSKDKIHAQKTRNLASIASQIIGNVDK